MDKSIQFPIGEVLSEIATALAAHTRLIVEAPPGAGKTTQVPTSLLDAEWLGGRKILMLEPRRIAARAAAEFMASQRGEEVGDTIGYRIRFESKVSARTRIEVVTEGILARMIQANPELGGIGAVLFDEFHERHLQGDLGAALALDVQASLRPDLRLVIMSATLDGERIARWFDAPRITSAGRSFPVRVEYPPSRPNEEWPAHMRRTVETALKTTDGDVLVFLAGRREIDQARMVLHALSDIELVPLHGELSLIEQHAVLSPTSSGKRRIVLATNIAESSVTLPGIRAVIDTGFAREPRLDPNSGFTRLETIPVSQASADQRAGRAGRVAPGIAYRLWPQSQRREASRRAEINQVELSGLALDIAAWGSNDLRWLDPPPSGALAGARDLLILLGALDPENRITAFGRVMLATGATPRLAAALLRAPDARWELACDLIALIDARTPLRGDQARSDDFEARYAALADYRRDGARAARAANADVSMLAAIDRAAKKWRRRGEAVGRKTRSSNAPIADDDIGNVLVHAFPDRVARQDENDPRRYRLSNGRGAHVHSNSELLGEQWLVAVDLRYDEGDSLILSAAPFDAAILEQDFSDRIVRERIVRWNEVTRSAEAFEVVRFAELVLEQRSVPTRPGDAHAGLSKAVHSLRIDALPWSDQARSLRTRVNCLREWIPDLDLPDLSDDALHTSIDAWLMPHLDNATRLDALTPQLVGDALAARLDYAQHRAVDELAPESIAMPSGNMRRLEYHAGQSPVLAVKLQELFGLADTPRIARAKVPVTLHLLSPAQRPIQVTQDLRGFWERTYPEVKKELKGRYPKHPWPDDPWSATPTHRAKPRGK
ncbi:MAG TPA: ATP-dependent helicase HrpB [Rudaea sp.]|nr:ATP-dependent helicase HrpB [Rudaea sp.]